MSTCWTRESFASFRTDNLEVDEGLGRETAADHYAASAIQEGDLRKWMRPALPDDVSSVLESATHSPSKPEVAAVGRASGDERVLYMEVVDVQGHYVRPASEARHVLCCENPREEEELPVLTVYGLTREGHSVAVNCWNYWPYFYVSTREPLPPVHEDAPIIAEDIREGLEDLLSRRFRRRNRWTQRRHYPHPTPAPRVSDFDDDNEEDMSLNEIARRMDADAGGPAGDRDDGNDGIPCIVAVTPCVRERSDSPSKESSTVFKIEMRGPNMMYMARNAVMEGQLGRLGPRGAYTMHDRAYECAVKFESRFMYDQNLSGAGMAVLRGAEVRAQWAVPDTLVSRIQKAPRRSGSCFTRCQLEINTDWRNMWGVDILDQANGHLYERPSNMRCISYDIEVLPPVPDFPEAEHDPVINVSMDLHGIGATNDEPQLVDRVTCCLGTTRQIEGIRLVESPTEGDLLNNVGRIIALFDADITYGYNSVEFDLPFLLNRAKRLGGVARDMTYAGRWMAAAGGASRRARRDDPDSKDSDYRIDGRIEYDAMITFKDKYADNRLDTVAFEVLGDRKIDMSYEQIPRHFFGGIELRTVLNRYCVKDAALPRLLMSDQLKFGEMVELCRISGIRMHEFQKGGATDKSYSMLVRMNREENVIVEFNPNVVKEDYGGATVITPIPGYYDKPIALLDFSALYPSIMCAMNLCFRSCIRNVKRDAPILARRFGYDDDVPRFLEECTQTSPTGDVFLKKERVAGILPKIERFLLAERKRVKGLMAAAKKAGNKKLAKIYDMRQLAIKIICNSLYGFTGAGAKGIDFYDVARTITAYGREQLEFTKRLIEETFTIANGYPADAKCIYGDTDSVMVDFGIGIDHERFVEITTELHEMSPIEGESEAEYRGRIVAARQKRIDANRSVPPSRRVLVLSGKDERGDHGPLFSLWARNGARGKFGNRRSEFTQQAKDAVARVFELGAEASAIVNKQLIEPNELEVENIIFPYLLSAVKKRYAGVLWFNAREPDGYKIMGFHFKRKDQMMAIVRIQGAAFDYVLKYVDGEGAYRFVVDEISRMIAGNMDLRELVMSKQLKKRHADYDNNQPHAYLDYRMGNAFDIGDRVSYLFAAPSSNRGHTKEPSYTRAYEVTDFYDRGMTPDYRMYAERIAKSAKHIFENIFRRDLTNDGTYADSGTHNLSRFYETRPSPAPSKRRRDNDEEGAAQEPPSKKTRMSKPNELSRPVETRPSSAPSKRRRDNDDEEEEEPPRKKKRRSKPVTHKQTTLFGTVIEDYKEKKRSRAADPTKRNKPKEIWERAFDEAIGNTHMYKPPKPIWSCKGGGMKASHRGERRGTIGGSAVDLEKARLARLGRTKAKQELDDARTRYNTYKDNCAECQARFLDMEDDERPDLPEGPDGDGTGLVSCKSSGCQHFYLRFVAINKLASVKEAMQILDW